MQREYKRSMKMSRVQLAIFRKFCCCLCNVKSGNFLSSLYLLIKLLYLAVGVGIILFLQTLLDEPFHFYGLTLIRNMFNGAGWKETGLFPRVTLCDYVIRVVGNQQQNTVQCVLPVNMINEKLFGFLWWWVAILLVLTFVTL